MSFQSVDIVMVRHAQSRWNAERRYQGHECLGLSELGLSQAEALAESLAAAFPDLHAVVCSDLKRVRQTAAPFLAATGREARFDRRWREIDVGAWAGMLRAEAAERFPDEMAAWQLGEDVRRGGGETFAEMRARIWDALTDLAVRSVAEQEGCVETLPVLVFAHGGPIRVASTSVLGLPPLGHRWINEPINCAITQIRVDVNDGAAVEATLLDHDRRLISTAVEGIVTK